MPYFGYDFVVCIYIVYIYIFIMRVSRHITDLTLFGLEKLILNAFSCGAVERQTLAGCGPQFSARFT